MSWLLPVPVVVPLLAAALNTALDHVSPKWLHSVITLGGIGTAFGFSIAILVESMSSEPLHWFGGWEPRSGVSIGIAFAVDPIAGGAAVMVCALTLAALVYSLTFIDSEKRSYDVLMATVCAAVCGFVFSADLFNIFVWLELVGVAGYALTGFDIQRVRALHGALNFAIVNTVGGYFVLLGIALLYARTGALNLAQIGRTLSGEPATAAVIVAMTLITVGFLCKAAVVPFHFWLPDAYAVAPAPVCLLLAGILTDAGLFGVARVWFTVFDAPFGGEQRLVGDTFLWIGLVTALVGGAMALAQRNLKRVLAYSVVCHIGIIFAGVGMLSTMGLAGAALTVVAHGFVTGGLFLLAGILVVRPRVPWLAPVWLIGAVALVGPPYVGSYIGHSLIDDAAVELHRHWPQPLLWLAGTLAGAALIREGIRAFVRDEHDDDELEEHRDANVPLLATVATVLVVLGCATSLVPGLVQRAAAGADRFRDRAGYADRVLHGEPMKTTPHLPVTLHHSTTTTIAYAIGSLVLAVGIGVGGRRRLRILQPAAAALRAVHAGAVGDYVMWIVVGTAVIGGAWAIALR